MDDDTKWTALNRQKLQGMLLSIESLHRHSRKFRRGWGVLSVVYAMFVLSLGAMGHYVNGVINLLVLWIVYKFYKVGLRRERKWLIALHHAQRAKVEDGRYRVRHLYLMSKAVDSDIEEEENL
ncbi:MAG: hypothetical protein JZU63_13575 [Rhodoferax sp.]|nr:hypothetical protein [Rhodoferax sp.]